MAVDRGGLRYQIEVRDEFSASIGRFISEIGAAKDAFAQFRAESARGRTVASSFRQVTREARASSQAVSRGAEAQERALRQAATSARQLQAELATVERRQRREAAQAARASQARVRAEQAAARERIRILQEEARAARQAQQQELQRLRALADAQRRRERESRAIFQAQRRDEALLAQQREAARRADPEAIAEERVNQRLQRQIVARKEINRLRQLGREDLVTRQLRAQAGELERASRAGNNLLFTFRRLVGTLAAFTIARELVSNFRQLIALGVTFNDSIRRAEISIAGLVTGLADVRDEQGRSLGLADEFAAAQGAARRQVALLRQDALRTTATFEQLLDTFQIAIGPGFAAGLNLDQIRALSVSISQAATAIGVPQNQLAEEIRSLLSGTIQARTTRIATALQITNADIRRLRETGQLFDFLEERFQALGLAAERAARQTLDGIGNLVRDAVGRILGGAAEPLFEELIKLGNELFDEVLTIRDAAGNILPNPRAVQAFQALFEALREGVVSARELGQELGFAGLENILRTVGTALVAGIQFAIGFVGELADAFSQVAGAVRAVARLLGVDVGRSVGDTARRVGQLLAQFLLLRGILRLFGLSLRDIAGGLGNITRLVIRLGPLIRANLGPLLRGGIIGLGLVAILKGFELILEKILDVNLTLEDTARLIGLALLSAVRDAITEIQILSVRVGGFFQGLFLDEEGRRNLDRALAEVENKLRFVGAAAVKEVENRINQILDAASPDRVPGAPGGAPDAPAGDDGAAGAERFAGIISNVESAVARANAVLGDLDQELVKVGLEFEAAGRKAGLEGLAGALENELAKSSVESGLALREVSGSLADIERQRAKAVSELGIAQERLNELEKVANANAEDRMAIEESLNLTAEEGQLVSLLRDEAILRERIAEVLAQSAQIAGLRGASLAREELPALQRATQELELQVAAEERLAGVIAENGGARRRAVVEAENELAAVRAQSAERRRQLQDQLAFLRAQAAPRSGLVTAEERARERERQAALRATIAELEKQLGLENRIADAKEAQTREQLRQARLAESGSFAAGARAGIEQLAEDLPTIFEGARDLVVDITNQVSATLARAAVDFVRSLADEDFEADFEALFAQLGLSVAERIFQNVIDNLLQEATARLASTFATDTVEGAGEAATEEIQAQTKLLNAQQVAAIETGAATQVASTLEVAAGSLATTLQGAATSFSTTIGGVALREVTAAQQAALVRTQSAASLQAAAAAEVTAARTAAALRTASSAVGNFRGGLIRPLGLAGGGTVPRPSPAAASLARRVRPRSVDPRDSVGPLFLQPGEFVVRKSVVDSLGVSFFRNVNAGRFRAPGGNAPAGDAGAGMQEGGLVTRRESASSLARDRGDGEGGLTVLPAVVTSERELDRLQAGGRNAQFRFLRENAGAVRGILGITR